MLLVVQRNAQNALSEKGHVAFLIVLLGTLSEQMQQTENPSGLETASYAGNLMVEYLHNPTVNVAYFWHITSTPLWHQIGPTIA